MRELHTGVEDSSQTYSDRTGGDQDATIGVREERVFGGGEEGVGLFDVGGPAL